MSPTSVFLGFRAKQPWTPVSGWADGQAPHVERVCSVADCLAEPPSGWVERWDFNCAGCYSTEAAALASVPEGSRDHFELFAYWVVPLTLGEDGREVPVNARELFSPSLPPLPVGEEARGYASLGFDVAVPAQSAFGFEHSPLSCNLMAQDIAVNRYCLIDRLEEALVVARRFNAEQPEPGQFIVVEVAMKVRGRRGEGLDVQAAKVSGLDNEKVLERARGQP